jgi:hypothetical protein
VLTLATIFLLAQRARQRPAVEKAKVHAVAPSTRPSSLTDRDAA